MSRASEWVGAYARQADADLRAWELYEKHPGAVAAECHKLLFLQMACEKLCKAYLIQAGMSPDILRRSHGVVAKHLPGVIRQQIVVMKPNRRGLMGVLAQVRHMANEIEILNPAVRRDEQRPDNCEYPWESGEEDARIISPLDWSFHPARLVTAPAGRTFLKLLRGAIDRIL